MALAVASCGFGGAGIGELACLLRQKKGTLPVVGSDATTIAEGAAGVGSPDEYAFEHTWTGDSLLVVEPSFENSLGIFQGLEKVERLCASFKCFSSDVVITLGAWLLLGWSLQQISYSPVS